MKIVGALALIVVLGVGGYFLWSSSISADGLTNTGIESAEGENEPASGEEEEGGDVFAATVEYSDTGFAPTSVTVKVGETVRFVNTSSHDMWVATASHPTHSKYDGTTTVEHCSLATATNGTFDQCQAVPAGSMWDYTFAKAGTWPYHNHSRSSDFGSVTVTGVSAGVSL